MAIIGGTSTGETLNGTSDADTITAGEGDDTIFPGSGVDLAFGEDGNDTIVLAEPISAGDVFDGGTGMDTLELRPMAPGFNFATVFGQLSSYALNATTLTSIERLSFASSASVGILGSLTYAQVVSAGITDLVGGAGRDILVIGVSAAGTYTMPAFNLSNGFHRPRRTCRAAIYCS